MGTALINREWDPTDGTQNFQITDAQALAIGEFVALDGSGRVRPLADTAGYIPVGIVTGFTPLQDLATAGGETETGATSATLIPEAIVQTAGGVLKKLTVTGATGVTDVGKWVYGTAVNTFTLTETTNIGPVGRLVRCASSTDCDVEVLSAVQMALATGGLREERVVLGAVHTTALEGTAAATLISFSYRGAGIITKFFATVTGFDAGYAAGDQTFDLNIAGTPVTVASPLQIQNTDMDAIGDLATEHSVTPTAANTFTDGQAGTVTLIVSGTGFTAAIDTVSVVFGYECVRHPVAGN